MTYEKLIDRCQKTWDMSKAPPKTVYRLLKDGKLVDVSREEFEARSWKQRPRPKDDSAV